MVDRIVPATTDPYRDARCRAARRTRTGSPSRRSHSPCGSWRTTSSRAGPAWEAGGAMFTDDVAALRTAQGPAAERNPFADRLPRSAVRRSHDSRFHRLWATSKPPPGPFCGTNTCPASRCRPMSTSTLTRRSSSHGGGTRRWDTGPARWVRTDPSSSGSGSPSPRCRCSTAALCPTILPSPPRRTCACIAPLHGFDPGIHAREMEDPAREPLQRLAAGSASGRELAAKVIGQLHLLGDEISTRDDFIRRTGELIDIIHQQGPLAAARAAAESTDLLPAESRSIR